MRQFLLNLLSRSVSKLLKREAAIVSAIESLHDESHAEVELRATAVAVLASEISALEGLKARLKK